MPEVSRPMKTASYLLRLTPQEKLKLERLARERHITLAHALREGARMLLEDAFQAAPREAMRT